MKNLGTKYNFRNLTPQQFDILEDCSSDFRYYQENGLIYQGVRFLFNFQMKYTFPYEQHWSDD